MPDSVSRWTHNTQSKEWRSRNSRNALKNRNMWNLPSACRANVKLDYCIFNYIHVQSLCFETSLHLTWNACVQIVTHSPHIHWGMTGRALCCNTGALALNTAALGIGHACSTHTQSVSGCSYAEQHKSSKNRSSANMAAWLRSETEACAANRKLCVVHAWTTWNTCAPRPMGIRLRLTKDMCRQWARTRSIGAHTSHTHTHSHSGRTVRPEWQKANEKRSRESIQPET